MLHSTFTHLRDDSRAECRKLADFHAPVFIATDAIVLYFQSTVIFPGVDVAGSVTAHRDFMRVLDKFPFLPGKRSGGSDVGAYRHGV